MSLFGGSEPAKITVIAQIRAKSGHESDVRKIMQALPAPSLKEPGCLGYKVFEDKDYTGSFFTIEEWETEDALYEHLRVNKAALDKLKAMLREDLRINLMKPTA